MQRRKFGREFKVEAVRLVKHRGVSVAQASRDLDVHENVLRKWVREFSSDPAQAFSGPGQMKVEQVEIERPRKEVTQLKGGARTEGQRSKILKRPVRTSRWMRMKFAFVAQHRAIWPVA